MEEIQMPEGNIKIAQPEEKLWLQVKEEAQHLIQQSENNIIIQKGMLEIAEQKLKQWEK